MPVNSRLIRPAVVCALIAALGAPGAIASPAAPRGDASRHAVNQRAAFTPSDEAEEYVSLSRAVEHAARQQREQALRRVHVAAAADTSAGWRVAALIESVALLALAFASLMLLRARRRTQRGVPARRRASQAGA